MGSLNILLKVYIVKEFLGTLWLGSIPRTLKKVYTFLIKKVLYCICYTRRLLHNALGGFSFTRGKVLDI